MEEELFDINEVPELEGWVTCSQAADIIDISRQSVNRMVNRGDFKTLHRLGGIFVLKTSEVSAMANDRKARLSKK